MLYRVKIKPKASYISMLQSDTFSGAFFWSYRYLYGEDELRGLLSAAWEGYPMIVFSNAFPENTLPLPLGIYDEARNIDRVTDKAERKQAYQQNKKYKKCHFLNRREFLQVQQGNWRGFSPFLSSDPETIDDTIHNMVPRSGSDTSDAGADTDLFSVEEKFVNDGIYDLYILTEIENSELNKTLELMFTLGIGARKSVGKGSFDLLSLKEEQELTAFSDGNAFLALSNFIPAKNDPVDGNYKTLVKYGKLDRELSVVEQPFKKPLMFLEAGAVFRCDDQGVRPYYGRCLHGIAVDPNISVNAFTIAIPMRLPE